MPYVQRDENGNVHGIAKWFTPDVAEEFLEDNDPQVIAFLNPTPPPVDSISARQFRIQLRRAGLLDTVKAWVAQQDGETQDAFEYSGTFVRSEPTMAFFSVIGFTEEQIDAFFETASSL
jgi:hypothetical protein